MDRAAEDGLLKLLAALPHGRRGNAEQIRERIHFEVAGWHRDQEAAPFLPILHRAVQGERRVRIAYVRSDGEASDRTIDPLGLVAKGNVWYLVGATADQFRTCRVSRIHNTIVTDQVFTHPSGFDLASYSESSKNDVDGSFPQVRVIFRADSAGIDVIRFTGRWSQVESIDESTNHVIMQFERVDDAVSTALAISPHVELIEPADLRNEVIAQLRAALERYV